jgi:hypothetical protein
MTGSSGRGRFRTGSEGQFPGARVSASAGKDRRLIGILLFMSSCAKGVRVGPCVVRQGRVP